MLAEHDQEQFSWAWLFEPLIIAEGDEFERVLTWSEAGRLVSSWDVDWCPDSLLDRARRYLFAEVGWRWPDRPARFRDLEHRSALVRDGWLLDAEMPIKLHTVEAAIDLARDLARRAGAGRGRGPGVASLEWLQSALIEVGLVLGVSPRIGVLDAVESGSLQVGTPIRALQGADLASEVLETLHSHGIGILGLRDRLDLRRVCSALADTPDCLAVFGIDLFVQNVDVPSDPWKSIPL